MQSRWTGNACRAMFRPRIEHLGGATQTAIDMKHDHRLEPFDAMDRLTETALIADARRDLGVAEMDRVNDMLHERDEPELRRRGVLLRHVRGVRIFDDDHASIANVRYRSSNGGDLLHARM